MYAWKRHSLAALSIGLGVALLVLIASETLGQEAGWPPPANISATAGTSYYPRLGVDAQDTVHLIWQDWVDLAAHWPYILYANKPAGGEWTSFSYVPVKVQGVLPAMVVAGDGALHVVWANPSGIHYQRRAPDGTWSGEDIAASPDLESPDVAVAPDGTLHVAWRKRLGVDDYEIYHCAKPPGSGCGSPVLVFASANARNPLIATDSNGTAHLLIDNSGYQIQVLYASRPAGGNWSIPHELLFAPRLTSVEQFTSDAQGGLHLAWGSLVGGKWRVRYASKPLDLPWSGPETVFSYHTESEHLHAVAVAADGQGWPHVAWTDTNGDKRVWYAFKRPDAAWAAHSRAAGGLVGYDHTPSLAVDGVGGRHIAWDSGPEYDPPSGDGRGEIWYTGLTGWPPATGVITPAGGTLTSSSGDTRLDFPPGSVTTDTEVTHTPAGSPPSGELVAVKTMDLSAQRVSDGAPVTEFALPYTLTVHYCDADLGIAIESTLGLYWWNVSQWVLEPSTDLDAANNCVTASLDHMTFFAVLGETNRLYLPLLIKNQ